MATAVDKWPAYRQTLSGRAGRPLAHSSYTITRDTTTNGADIPVDGGSTASAGIPSERWGSGGSSKTAIVRNARHCQINGSLNESAQHSFTWRFAGA
ncbi:MAG TPA: hypothetical protein VGM81_23355, partial [Burkholderiaceae bacterium]